MSKTLQLSDQAVKRLYANDTSLWELVMLKHYCMVTGDTAHAVHSRRRRGQWIDGVHCHVKSGRRIWINVSAVKKWVIQCK